MKAIGYLTPQAIEQGAALVDFEQDKPTATGRDLLIKVRAVSVNPVDAKVRKTAQPDDKQHKILGWDAVGEVVATGEQTQYFNVGDLVWYAGDLTRPGCNAEYQLVDERIVGLKPHTLSDAEAAALPLTAITAWELLFDRLGFIPQLNNRNAPTNDHLTRVLIVGAAGGVGSILTQLVAKLTNAVVIGTASREQSQAWVKTLGAHHVINHHKPLQPQLSAQGFTDVTHVISLTHTEQHFAPLVEVLAPQGKLALIDDPGPALDIMQLKRKSLSLHWEFMFTRPMFNTWDIDKQHQLLTQLAQLIDDGVIKTTLGEHYGTINAANLKRAHAAIESQKTIGKIVLEGF